MVESIEMSRISSSEEDEEAEAVLTEARHLENITAPNTAAHSWRLKERVRIRLPTVIYVLMLVSFCLSIVLWCHDTSLSHASWFMKFELVYNLIWYLPVFLPAPPEH